MGNAGNVFAGVLTGASGEITAGLEQHYGQISTGSSGSTVKSVRPRRSAAWPEC